MAKWSALSSPISIFRNVCDIGAYYYRTPGLKRPPTLNYRREMQLSGTFSKNVPSILLIYQNRVNGSRLESARESGFPSFGSVHSKICEKGTFACFYPLSRTGIEGIGDRREKNCTFFALFWCNG